MSITQDVKSLAIEAGFHAVGITSAEPFIEAERTLNERLEAGLLDGSGYTDETIHRCTHPHDTLPTARSIISLALSYLTDEPDCVRVDGGPRGWMARFSRGADYHTALNERLSRLAHNIQLKFGRHIEVRAVADTGPLADRSAAIRSGLGLRGVNTCVYAGEYGSWVVLGELITDLELEADAATPTNGCGECRKCMKACPTGALCAPHTVDVPICISRVTQSKGFIPHRLREAMGVRIYGCDTCQSACPMNMHAVPGNLDEFRAKARLGAHPELLPLLNISSAEFKAIVGPTTAGWIRRTRFRRNVAIALGNIRDPAAVPGLMEALADPEPVIRGHVAWSLGRLGTGRAVLALEAALSCETDARVESEIRLALEDR